MPMRLAKPSEQPTDQSLQRPPEGTGDRVACVMAISYAAITGAQRGGRASAPAYKPRPSSPRRSVGWVQTARQLQCLRGTLAFLVKVSANALGFCRR